MKATEPTATQSLEDRLATVEAQLQKVEDQLRFVGMQGAVLGQAFANGSLAVPGRDS